MSRKSSRLKHEAEPLHSTCTEPKHEPTQDGSFEPDSDGEFEEKQPARKKRKMNGKGKPKVNSSPLKTDSFDPKWRYTRGRRGLLKQLISEAPLDILFEIFSHLAPLDLLHLVRSCKEIRSLLLDKSSAGTRAIWRSAREGIPGLPGLPCGMSEPFYASLLFDTFCMNCSAPNVSSYMYRRRICQGCFNDDCLDQGTMIARGLLDAVHLKHFHSHHPFFDYLLPRYTSVQGRHYIVGNSLRETRQLLEDFAEQPVDDWPIWERQLIDSKASKQLFADECQNWVKSKFRTRAIVLDELRDKRWDQIMNRLKDLGYAEDVSMNWSVRRDFRKLKGVRKPQELTDRIWNNIKADIIPFMDELKDKRISREIVEARRSRCSLLEQLRNTFAITQPAGTILPNAIDIALFEPFTSLLEEDLGDKAFTKDDFAEAWLQFPQLSVKWRESAIKHLLAETKLQDENDLNLAIHSFKCRICYSGKKRFPNILEHNCTNNCFLQNSGINSLELPEQRLKNTLQREPFTSSKLELIVDSTAEALLLLCGLNPETTTYQEVMDLNPLFECESCKDDRWRTLLNYPAALGHHFSHPCAKPSPIRFLPEDEQKALGMSEHEFPPVANLTAPSTLTLNAWLCHHCPTNFSTDALGYHMEQKHSIKRPERDVDYMLNYACDPVWIQRSYRFLVQESTKKPSGLEESMTVDSGGSGGSKDGAEWTSEESYNFYDWLQ